jgi:hypothetical protein
VCSCGTASLRRLGRAATIGLLLAFVPGAGFADDQTRNPSVANGTDPSVIDEPAFPGERLRDGVRIWTGSYFVPSTDFGQADLGLARPELRVRLRVPVNGVASLQLTGEFKPSFYDTSGSGRLFEDCADCPSPGDLYSTAVALKGGLLLNKNRHFLLEDEQWALLSGVYVRARFEPGAFEESVSPGFSLGFGYRIPGRLRVAIGGRIERALDGDGVKIGPTAYFRWDPAPKWRLRMRGTGLQLEYRILPRLELFATGFRSSNRFRMDDRANIGSGATFGDRQTVVGGGFVVKILRELRFTAESGAVVDRRVSFKTRSDGTLDSNKAGETMPYFSFRFEIRP